jgi:hypothetical protein
MPNVTIQLRRDTAANWTSANPTLASGELGYETDTGNFKIGNGSTAWASLSYNPVSLAGTQTLTNKTLTTPTLTSPTISNGIIAAGTTALAPLDFTAGALLTSPVEGAMEFDGTAFYTTDDVTDGRGYLASIHYFRLTADGGAITTIANFFGATSGMALDAGVFYEIEANLYFTKTTAGTATFTMTFSNGPTNNNANYVGTPVGGVGTAGTAQTAALVKSTATAGALPATGTLTTAVNHQYTLRAMFQANASTGGTLNFQVTSSAGSITPLTGSYYKLTRLPAANTGAFV